MTTRSTLLLLLSLGVLPAGLRAQVQFDPDIKEYGFAKVKNYVQTSAAAPGAASSYSFNVWVDKRPGGVLNAAKYGWQTSEGFAALGLHSGGADQESVFSALEILDSNRPNNMTYTLRMDTRGAASLLDPQNPAADYEVSLGLFTEATTAVYPDTAPTVQTNHGTWTDGKLKLTANLDAAFGWGWAGFNPEVSVINFTIAPASGGADVVSQRFTGTFTGGFTVAANTLTPGVDYVGRLTFANLLDSDTTSVPGATGYAFFGAETTFTIQAVPEPSTYVLVVLGGGVLVLAARRRRGRG